MIYTKGPWKVAGQGNGKQELSIFRPDGKEIACIRGEAHLEVARMISAAPEMLEALKAINALFEPPLKYWITNVSRFTNAEQSQIDAALDAVNSAIAKAEGRQ